MLWRDHRPSFEAWLRHATCDLLRTHRLGRMTELSTLRFLYPWWQEMMTKVPLAADFCWACARYHGEVDGLCDSEAFDWEDASNRFKICSFCHMSRFCSKRCHEYAWKAGVYKYLCKLNGALLSESLREQLRYKRAQWGSQRCRHVSMLQAIHSCWGLRLKFVWIPGTCEAL